MKLIITGKWVKLQQRIVKKYCCNDFQCYRSLGIAKEGRPVFGTRCLCGQCTFCFGFGFTDEKGFSGTGTKRWKKTGQIYVEKAMYNRVFDMKEYFIVPMQPWQLYPCPIFIQSTDLSDNPSDAIFFPEMYSTRILMK